MLQASTAFFEHLMQTSGHASEATTARKSFDSGRNAITRTASDQVPLNKAAHNATLEGLHSQATSSGHQRQADKKTPGISTSLSLPEFSSAAIGPTVPKTTSQPNSQDWRGMPVDQAVTKFPIVPMLPNPEPSWAPGTGHFGQAGQASGSTGASGPVVLSPQPCWLPRAGQIGHPGQALGSMGPSAASDPALQVQHCKCSHLQNLRANEHDQLLSHLHCRLWVTFQKRGLMSSSWRSQKHLHCKAALFVIVHQGNAQVGSCAAG